MYESPLSFNSMVHKFSPVHLTEFLVKLFTSTVKDWAVGLDGHLPLTSITLLPECSVTKYCALVLNLARVGNSLICSSLLCCSLFRVFHIFLTVFDSFSPILCPRVNCSHRYLLTCSFLKSDLSDLLLLLFTRDW